MNGIDIPEEFETSLADTFEVSISTVKRWRSGIARPAPRVLILILKEIERLENERSNTKSE